ncbi:MAG: DEAD/DEAH box helicase [Methanobrevibacter millerae]|uniref:RNA helicase n=2 Tax=Methanobrevibacter millerae TaxID=230361 RepID=A0A8T3VG37_9EURY|nr:DEAD/DEAH box helicase [Methanobrevibacter millerae]
MKLMNFNDLKINDDIKSAVNKMGFEKLTPIQNKAIPDALAGRDIIGQAQTGSGKTLAFGIPVLNKLFVPDRSPQAIILCPTRELCVQVADEIKKLAKDMDKVKVLAVYGGQAIGRQIRVLNKGVHIVVGTPGRVIDHIERGTLDLIGIETVVLDEADEMLDMGFREDIELILRHTPKQRQTLLFSATMPDEIKKITRLYQNNPKFIKISDSRKTIPKIKQFSFKSDDRDKIDDLCKLIEFYDFNLWLIFCNTRRRVDFVYRNLKRNGYKVDSIHGDMTQKVRDKVMNKFRNGNISILVASDIAARGIDVSEIDVVVNYDIPQNPEDYIHRIGRTARAGESGYAFNIVAPYEAHDLVKIRKKYNLNVKSKKVPSLDEIEYIKNKKIMDDVKVLVESNDLSSYVKVITSSKIDTVEIAAALLKMLREK